MACTPESVRPAATSTEGHELRFTARDDHVYVHVLADDVDVVTVPGVAAGPATAVADVGGSPLAWEPVAAGLRVTVPGGGLAGRHPAVRLTHVTAV